VVRDLDLLPCAAREFAVREPATWQIAPYHTVSGDSQLRALRMRGWRAHRKPNGWTSTWKMRAGNSARAHEDGHSHLLPLSRQSVANRRAQFGTQLDVAVSEFIAIQ